MMRLLHASMITALAIIDARRGRITICLLRRSSFLVAGTPHPFGSSRMANTITRRLSSTQRLTDAASHAVEDCGLLDSFARTDAKAPQSL